jgi:arylsulfatase A-like enzyme
MKPRFRLLALALSVGLAAMSASGASRPNILLCIADDASWHHFRANGDPVVRTPAFDRVASEGMNFRFAFCSSPSCTPSRGALLTGQHFWRLGEGANLWSRWPNRAPVYPELLAKAGYRVGHQGKGWSPGDFKHHGRQHNPAGPAFKDFATFLETVPKDTPFCFWFGSTDPHRPYERDSGLKAGLRTDDVKVPPFLPDTSAVRRDLLDYYAEIERFDRDLADLLRRLEARGQLDNTLVVITSDNGFPFPRGKATCYDAGTRMPLAIRWPARVKGGRVVDDFVSLADLAPTFLEAAGVAVPREMTGRSLLPVLTSAKSRRIERGRDRVFFGRERHANVRDGDLGYPIRALRTQDFLYLRNFAPDRWPAGDPPIFGDVDQANDIAGSPSKQAVVEHGGDPATRRLFELAFGQRPAEELYDLRADPWQTNNVANQTRYGRQRQRLTRELQRELERTDDPRVRGKGDDFDRFHYVSGGTVVRPSPR